MNNCRRLNGFEQFKKSVYDQFTIGTRHGRVTSIYDVLYRIYDVVWNEKWLV